MPRTTARVEEPPPTARRTSLGSLLDRLTLAVSFDAAETRSKMTSAALAAAGFETLAQVGDAVIECAADRTDNALIESLRGLAGAGPKNPVRRYTQLATATERASWFSFMNHGYRPTTPSHATLHPDDETWPNQVALYLHLARATLAAGSSNGPGPGQVVDIGCGRGGGLAALERHLGITDSIGFDLAPANLRACAERDTSARFVLGDATVLALPAGRVDMVVNVESSHCYPDLTAFANEVHRVLAPGASFGLVDIREATVAAPLFEWALDRSNFDSITHFDLTDQVLAACEHDAEHFGQGLSDERSAIIRKIAARKASWYRSGRARYLMAVAHRCE